MAAFEHHIKLTYSERVLLYLLEYERFRERHTYPFGVTQKGIAEGIDILPAHVPRTVKKLIGEGLVEERFGRVEGIPRKVRVYFLTPDGVGKANMLKKKILAVKVPVKEGSGIVEKSVEEILGPSRNFFTAVKSISSAEIVDASRIGEQPEPKLKRYVELWYSVPEAREFYNRDEELAIIESVLNSSKPRFISITGPWGAGKSLLAYRGLERVKKNSNIFWYTLRKNDTGWHLLSGLAKFLAEMGKKTLEDLLSGSREIDLEEFLRIFCIEIEHTRSVIVIDDYQHANDEIVDILSSMIKGIRSGSRIKLVLTMRSDTPAYMWCYSAKDIEEGHGVEIRLQGLEEPDARKILKNEKISEENLRKILMLTKGMPGILKALAENNERILLENTRFTPEELRLLMFLKDTTE
ncbi:MAG: AAA family ATPase [Thermoplasmata archaeon]|nr:AAA family ATPase [Thermoplasmata archaeon]